MNPKVYVANLHDQINKLMDENERLGLELKDFQWGASVEAEAADEARAEVSKLRAEVAGLRTGYQAYERVNAELKAEVEKVDSERKACWAELKVQGRYIDQLKEENDALRKDAERYRSMFGGDDSWDYSHHWCCESKAYVDEMIDTAMAQGEQS